MREGDEVIGPFDTRWVVQEVLDDGIIMCRNLMSNLYVGLMPGDLSPRADGVPSWRPAK
jgi:hypothetical protein